MLIYVDIDVWGECCKRESRAMSATVIVTGTSHNHVYRRIPTDVGYEFMSGECERDGQEER